ncbi:MAG: acetyl-CoA carboxylase, carboxyltransferase subunit beta [Bacillota bacterium]|nr:acetyl-CoA carboxylase, carboxyltransferase subunit beta [Bacillota bacterium]
MFIHSLSKKHKYASITVPANKDDKLPKPERICPGCLRELELAPLKVCRHCGYHFPIGAQERMQMIIDVDSFQEMDADLATVDPLDFPDYQQKLTQASEKSALGEAIVTGSATIGGMPLIIGIMDTRFMMGSMGSVVGEKVCRAAEAAIANNCPLVLCTASGGARMQEGILALMQMAKTSEAIRQLHEAGLLFVTLLTHPTTGGVSASFASLADIILAEPGALIAFTGPRVIEQTIGHRLPNDFQRAEFLFKHGMVDLVVERHHIRSTLHNLLKLHRVEKHE